METILATKSNKTDYRPLKWVLITVTFITFFSVFMIKETEDLVKERRVEKFVSVEERLKPFGKVNLPNTTPEINTSSTSAKPAEEVLTAYTGADVYNMACTICHTDGIAGSPRISDTEHWEPRIAKGVKVLRMNAINGYSGSSGYMPPKGGRLDLSDEDIHKAIDYMLVQIGK
jgi:cytochrome c5